MIPGIGLVGFIDGSPYEVSLADNGNSYESFDYRAVIFRIRVSRNPSENGVIAYSFTSDKNIEEYYYNVIHEAGQEWYGNVHIQAGNQTVETYIHFKRPSEPVNITIELNTLENRFIVVEPKTCTITINP